MNLFGWHLHRKNSGLYLRRTPKSVQKNRPFTRRRGMDAAKVSDLYSAWGRTPEPINVSLKSGLRAVRARCRNEGINNPYADKFLNLVKNNVVGSLGMLLQSQVVNGDGTIDKAARRAIEKAWREYGHEENISMSGTLDSVAIQKAYMHAVAEDGETLWMVQYGKVAGPWGIAFHQLDPELLDIELHKDLPGGKRIRLGIEIDRYNRPLAYYLRAGQGDYYDQVTPGGRRHQRIPAELIYHGFLRERVNQLRGVPWMASSLTRMRMLDAYEEAAVIAARIGAAKVGFIKKPLGEEGALGDEVDPVTGDQIMNAEDGSWFTLQPGDEVGGWNPDYPHSQFDVFVKAVLRGLGAGIHVDYPTISGDLSDVNFGSMRGGMNETRETWKGLHGFLGRGFLRWMYRKWLPVALAKHRIMAGDGPLSLSYEDKYHPINFQGKIFPWVDPLKDTQSHLIHQNERWRSRREIVLDLTGRDFSEVLEEIEEEEKDMKDKKIAPIKSAPIPVKEDEDDGSKKTKSAAGSA